MKFPLRMIISEKAKERRQHDRVDLAGVGSFVEDGSGITLPVGNLAYSGMLLMGLLPGGDRPSREVRGNLRILDVQIPLSGHVVRSGMEGLGILFDHSASSTLEALRQVIDPGRFGSTMQAMNKKYVDPPYQGADWMLFQGLGPTTVAVRFDSNQHGQVVEFHMNIKPAGNHAVAYKDNKFKVGYKDEVTGALDLHDFDASNDEHRRILRRVGGVFLGMRGLPEGQKLVTAMASLRQALSGK